MNTYEIRTQDGEGLCGIVTERAVQAKRNLSRGIVSLWATSDPAQGYAAVGYDPLAPGPLVLVVLDMEGNEVHREEVPEIGTPEPGTVTMDDLQDRTPQPGPPLDVPASSDGRGPDAPEPKAPGRRTTAGPSRFA